MHHWYGGWWGGGILMILFWVLVIAGVIWLVRDRSHPYSRKTENQNHSLKESAFDILQKRYASGDIDKEKYQEMKEELGGK